MAVTRSPFVKKQTTDYGYGKDDQGNTTYTDANGVTTIVVPAGSNKKIDNKSSVQQEKNKLGRAVNKAVALRRLLPGNAESAKDFVESLQKLKETGKTPKSVAGGLFNTLGQGINLALGEAPLQLLKGVAKVDEPFMRVGNSAFTEFAEGIVSGARRLSGGDVSKDVVTIDGKTRPIDMSWKDFVRQAKDPNFRYAREVGFTGLPAGVIQFTTDVVTSPSTYVGLPASQASKATKVALAQRVVTDLYPKYPELRTMPNLLDNIVRFGAVELPDYVRKNENIFLGISFAGKPIEGTAAIAKAWRHTLGEISPLVGDAIYKYVPKIQTGTARGAMLPLVRQGIGRGLFKGDDWIKTYLGGLAENSATYRYKGAQGVYNERFMGLGYKLMREIEALPEESQKQIYRVVENRSATTIIDDEVLRLANEFKAWNDNAYQYVADDRVAKIQKKWGAIIKPLGVIEDHIHHTMTDEAREWMRTEGVTSGWFDNFDYSATDLQTGEGISSYRKLRDATFDDAGKLVHAEKFMGEDVIIGSIEAINEISMRKIGIPWFKTDMPTIMKDTLYSYGRMVGRTAYYDRMMDFGPAVIKPLIKHVVPDATLVGYFENITQDLLDIRSLLAGRVKRGVKQRAGSKNAAATELESVASNAVAVLAGKTAQKQAVDDEILELHKRLIETKKILTKAAKHSTTLSAELKGEANDVLLSLTKQIEDLDQALLNGTGERFITMAELHKEYLAYYPDARDFQGKSAEWLAERIVRAAGGSDIVEAREASRVARSNFLREQIDALPPSAVEEKQFLHNELLKNEKELEAFQRIADVKNKASYASEGWIYGFVPDVTGEPQPFQIFTTAPMDNEFGTFAQMDDAIAGHAFPEGNLLDLRDPETFSAFLNPEFWADDLNKAWRQVGITEYVSESDVANMLANKGVLDETFVAVNPEKAELLQGLYEMKTQLDEALELGTATNLTHANLAEFFEWFKSIQQRIAYSFSPDNSDVVGGIASQWWFKNLVDDAAGNGYSGVLMPASNIFGDAYAFTSDEWAVLLPDNWKMPQIGEDVTAPWQTVKGNGFVQKSLENVMENHQLSLLETNANLRKQGVEVQETLSKRVDLENELAEIETQESAFRTLMRLNNKDNVLVDGKDVPRTQVLEKLARLQSRQKTIYDDIDRQVKEVVEAKFGVGELETQRLTFEERLPMLLDQGKVLETWTEGTGAGLMQEIQDMILLLQSKPAKGSTGASNAAYVDKVLKSIETSSLIDEPELAKAYERLTTLLHADEIKLAGIEEEIAEGIKWGDLARSGALNGKLVNDITEKGWEEIKGLGLQMPDEVLAVWGPNIKKLNDKVKFQELMDVMDTVNNYWKKWVTSTVGFFVRNGFAGMFMNFSDGVTINAIREGLKWAGFQNQTKRGIAVGDTFANWTKRAGIVDPNDLARAEWVSQVVAATGHGVTDDFAAPTIGRYKGAVYVDKYLQFYQRKNKLVERALRIPMALDSFNKGQTFDEAVARINRIHFDYSDLSRLDRYAKRVVPFWIWTSRNIPLQLTQIAARPKAYYEYERMKNEFPVNPNLIMPKWIGDKGPLGSVGNWVLTPDLPHIRLAQQLQSITTLKGLAGQAALPIKLPFELAANRPLGIDVGDFKTGEVKGYSAMIAKLLKPLTGTKYAYYDKNNNLVMDERVNYIIESLIPSLGQFNRVTGGMFGGKDTLEERMFSSWFNFFGIPARQIGEKQERSEIIRRQQVTNTLRQDLQKLVNEQEAQEQP